MIHTSLVVQWPETLWLRREPKYPQKSAPGGNKSDRYAIKSPLNQQASHEDRRHNTPGVHCGCQGQHHQIKQL